MRTNQLRKGRKDELFMFIINEITFEKSTLFPNFINRIAHVRLETLKVLFLIPRVY